MSRAPCDDRWLGQYGDPNQLRKFARLCTHRSVAISHYHSHRRALASPAVASIWCLSAFCLPSLHAHHTSRAQCVMAHRSRAKSRQLVQVDGTLIKVDGSWLSDPPIRSEIRHELVEFWMICGDRRHQHLPWLGLNARCRGPPAMIDGSANTALISKPIGAAERSVLPLPIWLRGSFFLGIFLHGTPRVYSEASP